MTEQDRLDDAILTVTGGPDWAVVAQGLANEIYEAQARVFDVQSWDDVNRLRGFAQGLAYVLNLRDATILAKQQREQSDADL
jgi:hypothetical protein